MAKLEIDYLPYEVAAPDTADNSFVVVSPQSYGSEFTYTLEVTSGSIQFCMGQAVGANSPVYASGAKIVLTSLGKAEIFYKAASGTDTFIVGF